MIYADFGTATIQIETAIEARDDSGVPSVNYSHADLAMAVFMVLGALRLPAVVFAQQLVAIEQNPGGTT